MNKKYYAMIFGAAGLALAAAGINNTLTLKEYTVRSEKITRPFTMVFLSDVHSQKFKDGGRALFELIDSAGPDCILLGGDIFDKYAKPEQDGEVYRLIQSIKSKYRNCFYVSGNHEYESGKAADLSQKLRATGISILGDESFVFEGATGQKVIIGGMEYDPDNYGRIKAQSDSFSAAAQKSGLFCVLVRHVPYFTEGDENFDLIISGHNHGGLWRFPKSDLGVAGGGRKLFPKFVHGEYTIGDTKLIVGSGITTSTYLLPRIYNMPEVVKVTLQPLRRF